jgi:uncharacterized protein (DUF924 family)
MRRCTVTDASSAVSKEDIQKWNRERVTVGLSVALVSNRRPRSKFRDKPHAAWAKGI